MIYGGFSTQGSYTTWYKVWDFYREISSNEKQAKDERELIAFDEEEEDELKGKKVNFLASVKVSICGSVDKLTFKLLLFSSQKMSKFTKFENISWLLL